MRLKKGFTLAEILIVLMVIGVIATMTIPSMMKGVTESQLKAGYKKAYNTISNFAAMERVAGSLPAKASNLAVSQLAQALNNTLSINAYANQAISAGVALQNGDFKTCMTLTEGVGTVGTGSTNCAAHVNTAANYAGNSTNVGWMVTEDNIAYTVLTGGATSNSCLSKQEIASQASLDAVYTNSCAVVIVDVNGLSKGPNTLESQTLNSFLSSGTAMTTLSGDQYQIFVGVDGATAGPRALTVTGRIAADLK